MPGFTRRAILQTFREMLEELPFDKITVSALTKACAIGHNTFYYHFRDIYDLLDAFLREELGWFERAETGAGWEENVKKLLYICQNNKRIVYHIFNALSRDRLERYVFTSADDGFCRYVRERAGDREIPPERIEELGDLCRYAAFGYFLKFLWNDMEDDVDSMVDRLSELFGGAIRHVLASEEEKAER